MENYYQLVESTLNDRFAAFASQYDQIFYNENLLN